MLPILLCPIDFGLRLGRCQTEVRAQTLIRRFPLCLPVPAAEAFPLAVAERPVADVARTHHGHYFDGSGALCCSLPDDRLPQQSLTHHLQTGSRHFWFPDGAAAHQVSILGSPRYLSSFVSVV